MTYISTVDAPAEVRPLAMPRARFPRLAIGASLDAIIALIGNALTMAYVEPYSCHRRRQQVVRSEGQEGRDPNW